MVEAKEHNTYSTVFPDSSSETVSYCLAIAMANMVTQPQGKVRSPSTTKYCMLTSSDSWIAGRIHETTKKWLDLPI